MGTPVDFPGRNFTFTHPGDGKDLPSMFTYQQGSGPVIVSCWELSPQELEEITKTGKVWLCVWGQGTPPVWVGGEAPMEYPTTGDGAAGSAPSVEES